MNLHVLHINLIAGRTGCAKIVDNISSGCLNSGIKSSVLVGYNFGDDKKIYSIYKTSNSRWFHTFKYKLPVGLNFLFDWMSPGNIDYAFLSDFDPYKKADIVHVHCIQGGYFNRAILPEISNEKKIVMTIHDDWIVSGNDNDNNLFSYKTKNSYIYRKNILCRSKISYIGVSERMTNKVKNDAILGDNRIFTIYNSVNTNIFYPKDKQVSKKKLGLPVDKKVIVSIAGSGNKSSLKGFTYVKRIIDNYKHNEDYFFVSLGNKITKKISANYQEIELVNPEEMSDYLNSAEIFLYPTLADSFGLVVAESLACKTPVLTFATGGVPELITHKVNGYIANYKDSLDLQKGFDYLLHNQLKMSPIDKKFSLESMIQSYVKLYNIIGENGEKSGN